MSGMTLLLVGLCYYSTSVANATCWRSIAYSVHVNLVSLMICSPREFIARSRMFQQRNTRHPRSIYIAPATVKSD